MMKLTDIPKEQREAEELERAKKRYIRRLNGGRTPSKYKPHQGAQEMARRRSKHDA